MRFKPEFLSPPNYKPALMLLASEQASGWSGNTADAWTAQVCTVRCTYLRVFFSSKYHCATRSWLGESDDADTGANCKLYADFCLCRGLAPLTLVLFKGQLCRFGHKFPEGRSIKTGRHPQGKELLCGWWVPQPWGCISRNWVTVFLPEIQKKGFGNQVGSSFPRSSPSWIMGFRFPVSTFLYLPTDCEA